MVTEETTDVVAAPNDVPASPLHDPSRHAQPRGDLLSTLPLELISACFGRFTLQECITVSHVSRTWRRAALADRSLWARYSVPTSDQGVQAAVEALSTLLARSDPVPFHFRFHGSAYKNVPNTLYNLVLGSLDRMAALVLDDLQFATRLMHLDAPLPMLTHLEYWLPRAAADTFYEFPAEWGARMAPRLEHLSVPGRLVLPANCQPFSALRTLRAHLPRGREPEISFSHIFPRLTSLQLYGVTAETLEMLTPLPPALECLSILPRCGSWETIDYTRLIHTMPMPCAIRKLYFDHASGFVEVLELFLRVYDDLWKLRIDNDYITFISTGPTKVDWTVNVLNDDLLRLDSERNGAALAHLQRLAALSMSLPGFVALCRVRERSGWERVLPRLRELRLDIEDFRDIPSLASLFSDGLPTGSISLPLLDFVELHSACTGGLRPLLTGPMPRLLAALLAGRGIGTIFIRYPWSLRLDTSDDRSTLSLDDVEPLLRLAECVVVGRKDDPLCPMRVTIRECDTATVSGKKSTICVSAHRRMRRSLRREYNLDITT